MPWEHDLDLPKGTMERANAAILGGKALLRDNSPGKHDNDPAMVLRAADPVLRCAFDVESDDMFDSMTNAMMADVEE